MSLALRRPKRLSVGSRVAAVSLSWGGAGDASLRWRYEQGKGRLQEVFGLDVVEMPHTLRGTDFVYEHPEARAADLMNAFRDPTIAGIFTCIGGDDSIRLLPHIDFSVITQHPKVLLGYSDTTIAHMMCLKAGVGSFYGPSILAEFAENVQLHNYTERWLRRALFETSPLGDIEAPSVWTSEYVPWHEANKDRQRLMEPHTGYEVLQGHASVQGPLIGGCIEVLEMMKQTPLWPDDSVWDGAILFLETSEDKPAPSLVEFWLRNYGVQGILQRIAGILWGKPYDNKFYEEYKISIRKVLREFSCQQLPVLYNASFGHTAPMVTLPYGALAEIGCEPPRLRILEAGVV